MGLKLDIYIALMGLGSFTSITAKSGLSVAISRKSDGV